MYEMTTEKETTFFIKNNIQPPSKTAAQVFTED